MNPTIKARWCDRLRTEEHRRTTKLLSRNIKGQQCFCALGLLVDIYAKEHDQEWSLRSKGIYSFDRTRTSLPRAVAKWAGFSSGGTPFMTLSGSYAKIEFLNDCGMPWSELADLIEAQL